MSTSSCCSSTLMLARQAAALSLGPTAGRGTQRCCSRALSTLTIASSSSSSPASGSSSSRLAIAPRPAEMQVRHATTRSPRAQTRKAIRDKVRERKALQLKDEVSTKPSTASQQPLAHALAGTQIPKNITELVDRYPKHPLLAFFPMRFAEVDAKTGEQIVESFYGGDKHAEEPAPETGETLEEKTAREARNKERKEAKAKADAEARDSPPRKMLLPTPLSERDLGKDGNSRSWLAPELRNKSSYELHQLWYILLMERNRLATSWEEARRLGIRAQIRIANGNLAVRNHRVRKSMARIKLVLNERRLALTQAQERARMPGAAEEELLSEGPTASP